MARSSNLQNLTDLAIAGGALTTPLWVQFLQSGFEVAAMGGGLILAALRIRLAWIELRKRKKENEL